jgi:hypothetical protein
MSLPLGCTTLKAQALMASIRLDLLIGAEAGRQTAGRSWKKGRRQLAGVGRQVGRLAGR